MSLRPKLGALCLLSWLFASSAQAYVTSAVLEYFGDDKCGFYLNGHELLAPNNAEYMSHWFGCLSTSDGTLPLKYFNNNGDNLLAAVNYDIFGDRMYMAYRLTVHHSSGDPVVVWGEPDQTKFLNVPRNHPFPADWFKPTFDDSAWGTAVRMSAEDNEGLINLYRMEDGHFKGAFGAKGFIPFLSHNSNGVTAARDTDLYRNHFSFPNAIGKVNLLMNPASAVAGQFVAFRAVPGRDAADFSSYLTYVQLPTGLDYVSSSNQGRYDPATRRLQWASAYSLSSTAILQLPSNAVISASGWVRPEKALGPLRISLRNDTTNVQPAEYGDAASFYPNQPAWFKVPGTSYVDSSAAPLILGVIIRGQLRVGGTDNTERRGANQVFVNYSVSDDGTPALKDDVQFSHAANGTRWVQGYYDASEDRHWTWADINKLKLRVQSRQFASRQMDRLGSLWVSVRTFTPKDMSTTFMAKVSQQGCAKLAILPGMLDTRNNSSAADTVLLPVNQSICPSPTPRPTRAPTPVLAAGATPKPTPQGPGLTLVAGATLGLGCLSSAPEPFKRGGAYLYFCLKSPADATLVVRRVGGQAIRTSKLGSFRPGNNQAFFDATDDQGNLLQPGDYLYQIQAIGTDGIADMRESKFSKVKDKSF